MHVQNGVPSYTSTRGGDQLLSFQRALLEGLARDGGLLSPTHIVQMDETSWRDAKYFPTLANNVLSKWLGDSIPEHELSGLLEDALGFPLSLVPLKGELWKDVFVLELFHGPTLSFKDFGARTMARMIEYYKQSSNERLTILVATSGDTGSAVADGFAGQGAVEVILLYPKGKVSPTQELQLVVEREGVLTLAIEGTFDDCQRIVKTAFQDPALQHLSLSSANSINIGRLLPQMLYYFWAVVHGKFEAPIFCVPSGNLGNLTAGVMAHLSGLPVHKFIAAHNRNDFFPDYLAGSDPDFKASVQTPSSAMDVGAPSNFERLKVLMSEQQMRDKIWATSVSDELTIQTIRSVYEHTGYLVDPHTAVGLESVRRYKEQFGSDHPCIVLATAHPAKFPEIVKKAIGKEPSTPRSLMELALRPKCAMPIPASYDTFRQMVDQRGA